VRSEVRRSSFSRAGTTPKEGAPKPRRPLFEFHAQQLAFNLGMMPYLDWDPLTVVVKSEQASSLRELEGKKPNDLE